MLESLLKNQISPLSPTRYTLCISYIDADHRQISAPDFDLSFVTSPRWTPLVIEQMEEDIRKRLKLLEVQKSQIPTPIKWSDLIFRKNDHTQVSIKKASEVLRLSEATVRRLCDSGEISWEPTKKGHRRISMKSLSRYLEKRVPTLLGQLSHVTKKYSIVEYPLFIIYDFGYRRIHSPDFGVHETIESHLNTFDGISRALHRIHVKMEAKLKDLSLKDLSDPNPSPVHLDPKSELLTTAEAAELLKVSFSTVKRLHLQGTLKAFSTPGGHRRFLKSEIEKLLHT